MRRRGIALFLRSLDNDYQQRLRADSAEAASRHGFDLTVSAASNDGARQVQQIETALIESSNGPQDEAPIAVLVSPVRDDILAPLAQSAARDGIGWVLLNREGSYLAPLRERFPGVPAFSITPNQYEIGRIQAEQSKRLMVGQGPIVYLTGPMNTSSASGRRKGMTETLDLQHGLTELEADWTAEGARIRLDSWLARPSKSPTPALVCAQNDEMALGARQALRDVASRLSRPDLADVPIVGCDGSPGFGQRLVLEHRLAATVELPSAAGPGIDWVAKWVDGQDKPPAHVSLPVASFPDLSELKTRAA